MKKLAIIGAGISGLFIANLFKNNTDYQITIYEKIPQFLWKRVMVFNYL